MKPTKDDGWGYVKETPNKPASKEATDTDELDDLWEDMYANELDEFEPPGPELTMTLENGDAAATKKLSNGDAYQPSRTRQRHGRQR